MEYKITNRGAEIYNLSSFDLAETFDCGQCFRWEALPCDETNGIQKFSAVVRGRYTTVYKHNNVFIIENCTEDELKNIFIDYFDLNLDYDAVRASLVQKLPILKDAAKNAPGIRILAQEPWEALCSFIISQNNNIPRIKGIISRLCETFGKNVAKAIPFHQPKLSPFLNPMTFKTFVQAFVQDI